jgi:succinoglycan biosynthesis transport protein ExoP
LRKYLNILKKHKYTLIAVPLFVVAIAYVLLRKLPDTYTSKATLSAGLADQSQQLLSDKADMQQEKTNQAFTNLIQMMQMRVIYDQVSYQLILHDLTQPVPYRPQSKLLGQVNPSAKQHAIEVYTQHYKDRQPLLMSDKDQNGLNQVLTSMKYDYESLSKKIKIYRVDNSDFITVEYDADSQRK